MANSFRNLNGSNVVNPSNFSGSPLELQGSAGGKLPASLGKVRVQVLLFESGRCPFVRRTRQIHEFKFTRTTINFMNAAKKEDISILEYGPSIGVSLQRASKGRMSTCFAEGYIYQQPTDENSDYNSLDVANNQFMTQYASQPSENIQSSPEELLQSSQIGQFQITGYNEIAAAYRAENDTGFLHQLFVPCPGLFTDIYSVDKAREVAKAFSFTGEDNDRSPLEDLAPVTRTREISEPRQRPDNAKPGEQQLSTEDMDPAPSMACVQLDSSFTGNLFERLGQQIVASSAFSSTKKSQLLGKAPGATATDAPVYANLNPGMHASYEKAIGIMPGLDFSVKIFNTTGQFPKATLTQVGKEEGVPAENARTILKNPAFVMREDYSFLDPLYVGTVGGDVSAEERSDGISTPSTPSAGFSVANSTCADVWKNFGVAAFVSKSDANGVSLPEFIIPPDAERFYLANQPYVIIEIDGGPENRFFIVIAHEIDVSIFEVTSDPEFVQAFANNSGKSINVLRGGPLHSRLIGSIKQKGASLLKSESFELSVQHFFGRLQVSIDGKEPVILERHRWSDKIRELAKKGPLSEGMIQEMDEDNKSGDNQSFLPIKLCGKVRVHVGHFRAAFNFSPIQYVKSTTISTAMPVTALEVAKDESGFGPLGGSGEGFGNTPLLQLQDFSGGGTSIELDAISILLRSKGARNGLLSSADDIESGKVVGYPGEEAAHFYQSCHRLSESIRGLGVVTSHVEFSEDVRKTIPGDPTGSVADSDPSAYAVRDLSLISSGTGEVETADSPCSIIAEAKIEPNPANAYAANITPTITLNSGTVYFYGGEKEYKLEGLIRPICTGFTVFIREDESDRWTADPIDITHHVVSIEDNWSRQERSFISHSASMKLYLSKGEAQGSIESIDPATGTGGTQQDLDFGQGGSDTNYSQTDHSDYLASLQDKYFYVTIYAWRENAGEFNGTMYDDLGTGESAKRRKALFTGLCNDVSFSTESNKIMMSCNLRDYSMVLENIRWLNSPYYDAVRDYNVILDVVAQAGFKIGRTASSSQGAGAANNLVASSNPSDSIDLSTSSASDLSGLIAAQSSNNSELTLPGRLIYELARTTPVSDYKVIQFGDEQVIWNDMVMPGKYGPLNEPAFKPGLTDPYMNILQKIAKLTGKTLFFDQNGVMHFDVPIDEAEMQQLDASTAEGKSFPSMKISDYFSWTVNDPGLEQPPGSFSNSASSFGGLTSEQPDDLFISLTSSQLTSQDTSFTGPANLAGSSGIYPYKWWNVVSGSSYSFKRLTKDVVNEIRIISSTPNMSKLVAGHLNRNSVVDPSSPSFIGFKRMFYQQQAVFGSRDTVQAMVSRYTRMFNAPVEVSFTVPGRTGLRPMQIIEFNGFGMAGAVRLLVGSVKNSINADTNSWETAIEGLYFIPGERVVFSPTTWGVNPVTGSVNDGGGQPIA